MLAFYPLVVVLTSNIWQSQLKIPGKRRHPCQKNNKKTTTTEKQQQKKTNKQNNKKQQQQQQQQNNNNKKTTKKVDSRYLEVQGTF